MTLLLPGLVLAILLVSVIDVPGGSQADLILPMVLLALVSSVLTSAVTTASGRRRPVTAAARLSIRHRRRSARRSMDRYIQTVVADLGTLSLKPTSATCAIRAGRRVSTTSPT